MKDERALVQKAKAGETGAFAQLYDRYVDKIYRYVFYKVGSVEEAEDLTAQVFLNAWTAIGRYKWTGRPLSAWLLRIAHNLVTDHYRTRREQVSIDDLPLLADPQDVEAQAHHRHSTGWVLRAVRLLTADQQQVIILRFLNGFTTEEVAQIMGKDSGAIRALQHRALLALKDRLGLDSKRNG